jgi:hypothetical protein
MPMSGRMAHVCRFGLLLALTGAHAAAAAPPEAALADAARRADWAAVRTLLAEGADVDAREGDGSTALHWASYHENREVADLLILAGAEVDAANDLGVTPLWAACENGSARFGSAPAASSADFYFPPWFVEAPAFWLAARHREAGLMRLLARHGADPLATHSPAYWTGDRRTAAGRMWLEEGETTALMAAVGLGGRDPLWSVDHRARVAEATELGRGPDVAEMEAATLEAARVAVELGVDVNAPDALGRTAVDAALDDSFDDVVAFLIEHGAADPFAPRDAPPGAR